MTSPGFPTVTDTDSQSMLFEFWSLLVHPDFAEEFPLAPSAMGLLNAFLPIFLVAFIVTLLTVPLVRWLAVKFDIVDHPDGGRKVHTYPVAYLGGAAVFLGMIAAILASYVLPLLGGGSYRIVADYPIVPLAITLGMFAVFTTGIYDDILHWDPRLKIAGQLVAAAGLAISDIGTAATRGLIDPFFGAWFKEGSTPYLIRVGDSAREVWVWSGIDPASLAYEWIWQPWYTVDGIYYWAGMVFITLLVLGACNAANLIDGLDGLLSGSVGIMAAGFVAVAVILAIVDHPESGPASNLAEAEAIEAVRAVAIARDDPGARTAWSEQARRDWIAAAAAAQAEGQAAIDAATSPGERAEALDLVKNARNVIDNVPWWIESVDLDGDGGWTADDDVLLDRFIETGIGPRPDWMAGSRLVLALALLGACLGFLPFNFNPAVIFLGDAGSLLLGYMCAVIILTLGSEGQTHYVIAGLIIFALPIMDTVLAILRRKLAGLPMSAPDRNHIHHILLRSFKSVKKAVVVLYTIDLVFVVLGVGLAAAVAFGFARYLLVYGVATVFFGMVGATAIKAALRHRWMMQTLEARGRDMVSEASTVPPAEDSERDAG